MLFPFQKPLQLTLTTYSAMGRGEVEGDVLLTFVAEEVELHAQ